jgi:hypothetical protein
MSNTVRSVKVAERLAAKSGIGRRWRISRAGCLGVVLVGLGGLTTAQAQNTHYRIRDLGVVGANFFEPGQPFVISNNGWVAGGAGVGAAEHAVLWRDEEMTDIGDPALAATASPMA